MKVEYTELAPSEGMLGARIKCSCCEEPTHEDCLYEGVCFSCLYVEAAKDQPPYSSIVEENK